MPDRRIATRLYVDHDLAAGLMIGLDHARAHYLRSVLRLSKGAEIAVFNGRDGEWLARIDGLGKGWCSLQLLGQRRPQIAGMDLWLLFAPIKRARIDFLAEKATELGCSRLIPIMTQYTSVSRVNRDRLTANAREAAEQCERLNVPEVADPQPLFTALANWPQERQILLCAESGPVRPIAEVLVERAADRDDRRVPWAVMTGPEGGFSRSELDELGKRPFVTPIGLGPRVLRADTAALAALACWQAILGDGRKSRPQF